jgi:hypothetical protein
MSTYKGLQSGRAQHNTAAWGNAWADNNKVTPAATLVANDVVVLMDVPAGVRLDRFRYYNGDFDTGTALVYDIGYRTKLPGGSLTSLAFWADDATVLRAATTSWQEIVFEPFVTTEPIEIVLIPSVAPTSTSGSPSISVQAAGQVVGIP